MKRVLVMLCAVALAFNSNAQDDCMNPDVNCDGYVNVNDLLGLLGYFGDEDLDGDGIWDSQDDCVGAVDECGVCNGEGPTVQVIDSIIVNYDSVFVDVLGEWLVFELSVDTVYAYQCFWECEMPWEFDGYEYSTVQIGDQCWFAENLRTTQYADGSSIPEVTDGATTWFGLNDGARCAYNDDASNLATYGYLYNWYAVDDARGLCPTAWHVPTDGEYTELTDFLGGSSIAGTQMKSSPSDDPSWDGTNTSGFSALAGGYRFQFGDFVAVGFVGGFWSSSPNGANAWFRSLGSGNAEVVRNSGPDQAVGFSVRCVRDAE